MSCLIKKTNKRGWIRIVEAFVAILLIAGIILIVIEQDQNKREDISSQTYNYLVSILREIQLDNNLRAEIINIQDSSLPVEWEEFNASAPQTFAKIIEKTPGYLECMARICATNDACLLTNAPDKTVYAESVIITSTIQSYNPRTLKIFCWEE